MQAVVEHAHDLILLGGALGLLSIFAGLVCAPAAWVGLRGAVPIYLRIIPVLQGAPGGERLFGIAFGTVVASLVVQGWTIRQAAALLGFDGMEH